MGRRRVPERPPERASLGSLTERASRCASSLQRLPTALQARRAAAIRGPGSGRSWSVPAGGARPIPRTRAWIWSTTRALSERAARTPRARASGRVARAGAGAPPIGTRGAVAARAPAAAEALQPLRPTGRPGARRAGVPGSSAPSTVVSRSCEWRPERRMGGQHHAHGSWAYESHPAPPARPGLPVPPRSRRSSPRTSASSRAHRPSGPRAAPPRAGGGWRRPGHVAPGCASSAWRSSSPGSVPLR
jgi:hypothetical protein